VFRIKKVYKKDEKVLKYVILCSPEFYAS